MASSLHANGTGVMDFFEGTSVPDDAPGPGLLENGVTRRRRAAMALQGNVTDENGPWRAGLVWLWERGGWQEELTWTGGAERQLVGSTWGWGALAAWRPSIQTGGGIVVRQSLESPEGMVAPRRSEAWGLLRYDRLSLVTMGDADQRSLWELTWQVEPWYEPQEEGMIWREFSLGGRIVAADRNAWDSRREIQIFGAIPVWQDRLRLLFQGGSETTWERLTLQSDLLPQGMVGLDLSYAATRWTSRSWGVRARLFAATLGYNDPEDIRDFGPTGDCPVISLRVRMAFNGPDDYFTPGRHTGPREKISESSRLR
ncbi:MAG: hypothetical protein RL318_480 [Fibrobacterota bacterium]|jgi:hypothetical protein